MTVVSLPVTRVRELKTGDHIKWKRSAGYDHHAVVESVHEDDWGRLEVDIIEFGGRSKNDAAIRRNTVYSLSGIYKYIYGIYDKCYDAKTVVERAISRLGERGYNMLTNNCEYFATWCKTGVRRCSQAESLKLRAGVVGMEKGCSLVAETGMYATRCAVSAIKNGTKFLAEAKGAISGGLNAVRGGVREAGKYALKSTRSVGLLGGVIAGVTELALFGFNCYKAQKNYKAALEHAEDDEAVRRCKQQRNRNIVEAGSEGAGGLIGSTVGAVIGSFIPVVGTVIGGLIGGIGGRWIGKVFGRFFGKKWF